MFEPFGRRKAIELLPTPGHEGRLKTELPTEMPWKNDRKLEVARGVYQIKRVKSGHGEILRIIGGKQRNDAISNSEF